MKMKYIFIIIISCASALTFGQNIKTRQNEKTRPFVLGLIDEIQSIELQEKEF
jgi:hypothetical protein